ncbi:zinc ribbon domain-containing protein [Thermoproteota archaeon]
MTTCPKCGEENQKKAFYCRNCGEKLYDTMYVKQKEKWGIVHIGMVLIAVIILITSFGLIMGGTTFRSIQELMTDEEGFIMSKPLKTHVSSYAIVVEDMDFDIDPMAWRWFKRGGGFLEFKITTESNDPKKEIFVGIARHQDIHNYLDPIRYHTVQDLDFGLENFDVGTPTTSYILHPGVAPTVPPTVHSFWIVHGSDTGSQTLTWEPETGTYYLVMMNADGSEGIDSEIKIGVRVPFFGSIGDILLGVGVVFGAIGVLMLFFTIKRNKP